MDFEEFFLLLILILSLPAGILAIRIVIKLRILVLEMIGNTWAVKRLIRFLEDSVWWGGEGKIEARAVRALGKIGDAQIVEPLIQALKHKYPSVRETAVEVLEKTGDIRAVEPLIRALALCFN
jgi:HEAT repeat protein